VLIIKIFTCIIFIFSPCFLKIIFKKLLIGFLTSFLEAFIFDQILNQICFFTQQDCLRRVAVRTVFVTGLCQQTNCIVKLIKIMKIKKILQILKLLNYLNN
jgi:hypothetical protein